MHAGNRRRALIIGGSLGGLFAGSALRAIGWDVDVFERSPATLESRGGGIVLQGDVVRAMQFAQTEFGHPLGVRSKDRLFLDPQGNELSRQYMPQTQTSWNTLYSTLKQAIPEENYHRGAKFVGFDEHVDGVTANFEDGRRANGDLLIGADGGNSTLRSLLLPDLNPSYSGYVVWCGLVDEPKLPDSARDQIYEHFVFQHDFESMMLEYMVPGVDGSIQRGRRRFNWLWYLKAHSGAELDTVLTDRYGVRRSHSVPPGAVAPSPEDWIRRMSKERLNPAFRALVDSTDDIFVQAIMDFQVPQMLFGRVLLLGDAAFIPRPHTAGSTAKAAANAVSLAQRIASMPNLEHALRQWEQQQLAEGMRMTDWGIGMGNQIMNIAQH
ncbi:2-polyprenyl-6-methoxyphenol hydroxylase-like FAD-dependent oxidoreductase [Paraburkholderia sp. BL6669N2]|nr:2-polyprenyl-6-methoxyphenol hydroxylase-like FAD-dependent oxidoreductase [Paraburkholderia sp. BL6669N2]